MGLDDFGAMIEKEGGSSTANMLACPLIMVVDDDPGVLDALEGILKGQYRVLACSSAHQAIAALNDEVRVVILDVKMKDRDGFWTCDELRRRIPHIPVIFYSAYQDAKDPFDIINQHQPFGYITKGTSTKLLLDLIERAVRYHKLILDGRKVIAEVQRIQANVQKLKAGSAT